METRKLGKNGPEVSAIALGSRIVSDDLRKWKTEEKQSVKTIQYGIDCGINFLNTADFYGMGMNELIIGKAIKGRRDKAFISVKTGTLRDHKGKFLGLDGRPEAIKNFCAYSLTRLGITEIDLYQPARIDPNVPIEETVGAIKDLIQEGKVRYLGLSEANSDQLKRAHAIHPVSALEIEYSLATRFIETEILPVARSLGVSIVPYSVLYYGFLTGNLSFPLKDDDYRKMLPRFQGENLEYNLSKVDLLKQMAAQKNLTASQLSLAWILNQGNDIIPVVGMSSPNRVEENIRAMAVEFSIREMRDLTEIFKIGGLKGDRYPKSLLSMVAS